MVVEERRIPKISLKTVNLQLLGLGDANLGQELADVVALVTLELNHLTIFGMIHHGAVASKVLHTQKKIVLGYVWESAVLGRLAFLHALTIFFLSKLSAMP